MLEKLLPTMRAPMPPLELSVEFQPKNDAPKAKSDLYGAMVNLSQHLHRAH